jgi:hypothetical protein
MRRTLLRWQTWAMTAAMPLALPSLAYADASFLVRRALPSVAIPAACLMLFMATIQRRR